MEWYSELDEYEKLVMRMNCPKVEINNAASATETIVTVESAKKQGVLIEAVQVLTDLNLSIRKAYISSVGQWSIDVFHVMDQNGNKLTDESVISYIEQSLGTIHFVSSKGSNDFTVLELTGTDRVGLLSEIFAVLAELQCIVVESKVWTHNGRIASLIYIKGFDSSSLIDDPRKKKTIEVRLTNVLKGDDDILSATTSVTVGVTHAERRLHQMMFADRDYDRKPIYELSVEQCPSVSVQSCDERCYSVVNVHCKDRNKLLFDVVCTLTDMKYIVYHSTVKVYADRAHLEFYIRHQDGTPINSEAERKRVIQCLQAAIERRASEGMRLELTTTDRQGLLADVTRAFRENGLNVTMAEISTISGNMTSNIFYVTDTMGATVDLKIIEAVRERIGFDNLKVKELPKICHAVAQERDTGVLGAVLLSLSSVKRNLYNLGLIRSYS